MVKITQRMHVQKEPEEKTEQRETGSLWCHADSAFTPLTKDDFDIIHPTFFGVFVRLSSTF